MEKNLHSIYEEPPKIIEAACNVLIEARKRYGLNDEMIFNYDIKFRDGNFYKISVEKKEDK